MSSSAFNTTDLVLAIPSKGALHEGAMAFLKECGIGIDWESGRQYVGRLTNPEGVTVLFLRAEEIALKIAEGTAHVGITGEDIFREKLPIVGNMEMVHDQLGFGKARLVLAVPDEWIDVESMEALLQLMPRFRERHHRAIRIATKFPNLTREFFQKASASRDYNVITSLGATEGAPVSGVADLISDLTSTGTTLRENRLKQIAGGTILKTQASLIANRNTSIWNDSRLSAFKSMIELFEGNLRAKSTYLVSTSIPHAGSGQLEAQLGAEDMKLVLKADSPEGVAYRLLVSQKKILEAVNLLRSLQAKNVVTTTPKGIFLQHSEIFERFTRHMGL